MQAAGVDRIGGGIRLLELPDPPPPQAGEVLLEVRACGVGNWDDIIRTGGWDYRDGSLRWRSAWRRPG